jgi:acyl-CoA thioesterase
MNVSIWNVSTTWFRRVCREGFASMPGMLPEGADNLLPEGADNLLPEGADKGTPRPPSVVLMPSDPDNTNTSGVAVVADPSPAGDGSWAVDFPDGLQSMGGVMHGGAVVGTMARAAALATGLKVATISAHLHSGVQVGPAAITATPVSAGRTATTLQVSLAQERLRATAFFLLTNDEADADLPVTVPPQMPHDLPPHPAGDADVQRSRGAVPFMRNGLDLSMAGDTRVLAGGDEAVIQAWMRVRVPHEDSAAVATMLLDALPPTLLVLRTTPALIFTIEFTVHLTPAAHVRQPEGTWYFLRQHTVWAIGALCVDDAELWTQDGTLIGTARQMRRSMPDTRS